MDNNTMLMHADERYVKAVEIINAHGGYTASLVESQKCNGTKLGMMVNKEGSDVSPVFLLPPLEENDCAEEIASSILNEIENAYDEEETNEVRQLLGSYEAARSFIFFRVCKSEGNEEYLKGVVHDSFLDLAVYYIVQTHIGGASASVRITEEHMKNWGIDRETIRRTAESNVSSAPIYSLGNAGVLYAMFGGQMPGLKAFSLEDVIPGEMYSLTYRDSIGGSNIICRQDVLQSIAEKTECDLVILPSSVDDIIIMPLPEISYGNICFYSEMVRDVNQNSGYVDTDKVLSDHAYVFSREEGRILDQLEVMKKY